MTHKAEAYLAVQAVSPGKLELARKQMRARRSSYVWIEVEACGVYHSDAATVEGALPIAWPLVPGHEVVGKINSLGAGVEGWGSGSVSPWVFSRTAAGIDRIAAPVTSQTAPIRNSRPYTTMEDTLSG